MLNGVHRAAESQSRKAELDRMAAMLSRGWTGLSSSRGQAVYGNGKNDFDPDSDFDLDKKQPLPSVPGDA
jgi:hypothetical protein